MRKEILDVEVTCSRIAIKTKYYGEIISGTGQLPVDKINYRVFEIIDGVLVLALDETTIVE